MNSADQHTAQQIRAHAAQLDTHVRALIHDLLNERDALKRASFRAGYQAALQPLGAHGITPAEDSDPVDVAYQAHYGA